MTTKSKNLSDSRGNSLGIRFFQVLLKISGPVGAGIFVWIVAFFYVIFDRAAFLAARPYLCSRFPGISGFRLRWHFYRLIVSQGHCLILAHWLRGGHHVPIIEHRPERLRQLLLNRQDGLILLISHVGCWQAALTYLDTYQRPVNLLIQTNANVHVARMFSGQHLRVITNDQPFGGLLECVAAIERGEIVCIMGDRQAGEQESAINMSLLNRQLQIPISPWLLAARCKCAIIPIFTTMKGMAKGIDFHFAEPILIEYHETQKPKKQDLMPHVQKYAEQLTQMAQIKPYQIFHYEAPKRQTQKM